VKLQPPQHLDGVNDPHVGVAEVVEGAQGEGRQRPHQTNSDVGNDCTAVEKGRSDVVHYDCLHAPVGVKNGKGAEDRVREGRGVEERYNADGDLDDGHQPLGRPHLHVIARTFFGEGG